ncbi:MAG: hypothetical protein ACRDGR_00160 [bacterium]
MGLTVPALLVVIGGVPRGSGWIPEGAGWILPLAAFALGAGVARLRHGARRAPAMETAVERGISIPSYRRSTRALESELERTRRAGRSLAILVIKLVPDSRSALENRTAFALVGAYLDDCLRDIDFATTDRPNQRYVIALPEATRAQAEETARRVGGVVARETGLELHAGIAEFRADSVLLEDLVQVATAACDRVSAPRLPAEQPPVLARG